MDPAPGRPNGRTPSRVLACLGLLVALFAMHGPSVDHMLAMPAGGMSGHSMVMAASPAQASADQTTLGLDGLSASASMATGAMDMGLCLATLRDSGSLTAPAAVTVSTASPLAGHARVPPSPATGRDPPNLDLSRLCTWRT